MNEISAWYENLLAQLAAESYLHDLPSLAISPVLIDRLRFGANHFDKYEELEKRNELGATRMTGGEENGPHGLVNDFFKGWEIIDHLPNKSSGFSATLLKNIDPESDGPEYTLSFRSTESKNAEDGGDVERDSSNGANGQIGKFGFAWAQMADMEAYFEDLMQGNLAHPEADQGVKAAVAAYFSNSSKTFNVTGYSLGSHLAQVFTLMHPDRVNHAYTFNGAGMGAIRGKDGANALGDELSKRLLNYRAIMDDPVTATDRLPRLQQNRSEIDEPHHVCSTKLARRYRVTGSHSDIRLQQIKAGSNTFFSNRFAWLPRSSPHQRPA